MKKLFILFSIALLNISCSNITSSSEQKIDNKIVGYWFNQTTMNTIGPKEYISGLKIDKDGIVSRLGIEISSGKIKISADSIGRFHKINKNSFKYEYSFWRDGILEDFEIEGTYDLVHDSLYIFESDNKYFYGSKFKKTELNTIVTSPVESIFTILIDSSNYSNKNINNKPSAYSYFEENDLRIQVYGFNQKNTEKWFDIIINDFNGSGEYTTSDAVVFYEEIESDDCISVTYTEPNTSDLKLIINSFENNQIEGTLSFKIGNINFTNGYFNVPVY